MAGKGEVVVIIQPTKDLIDKTIKEELLPRDDVPVHRVFHGDTVGEGLSVSRELTEYLKDPQDCGQIIFITHSVLPFVKNWPNKSSLHLLIDEDLQVFREDQLKLPHNHRLVTDDLYLPESGGTYGKVRVGDEDSVELKSRNKDEDDVHRVLQDAMRIIGNGLLGYLR